VAANPASDACIQLRGTQIPDAILVMIPAKLLSGGMRERLKRAVLKTKTDL
jgi:hypothetical protein